MAEQHRRKTAPGLECRGETSRACRLRQGLHVQPFQDELHAKANQQRSQWEPEIHLPACESRTHRASGRLSLALEKMAPDPAHAVGLPCVAEIVLEVKEQEALLDKQPDSRGHSDAKICKAQHKARSVQAPDPESTAPGSRPTPAHGAESAGKAAKPCGKVSPLCPSQAELLVQAWRAQAGGRMAAFPSRTEKLLARRGTSRRPKSVACHESPHLGF